MIRDFASFRYFGSMSQPMELRPALIAAIVVDPVPKNGSKTVSPANENIRINRSANSAGYGAGWPPRVEAPLISLQTDENQARISVLVSIESAFWTMLTDLYSPGFLRKMMYSMSFLITDPG